MSKWLKCDCGPGHANSYVSETALGLTTSTGFSLELDVCVPAATLSAIFSTLGSGFSTADWLEIIGATGQDGVYAYDTSGTPTWQFYADRFAGTAAGTLPQDISFHVKYAATWNSGGSTWDIVVSVDATSLFTYSTTVFGTTTDTINTFHVGGFAGEGVTNELYYVDNVVFKNAAGTTVFSDDFESGGTGTWSSTTGTVSVVDFTPSGGGGGAGSGLQAARVF